MARAVQDVGEVVSAVAGAVVGDDPLDAVDTVSGEPYTSAVHESDCRDCLFIVERFGVGQSGVAVDRRMQIHIPSPRSRCGGHRHGLGLDAALAVHPPPTALGNAAHLLDVDVHHVTGATGDDALRYPVQIPGGIEEPAPIEPQRDQLPAHRASTDHDSARIELEGDPRRGPLAVSAHRLDHRDYLGRGRGWLPRGCRRAVEQPELAELTEPIDPLGGTGPRDAHLSGHMGDRTINATSNEATTAFDGQWSITVGHGRVPSGTGRGVWRFLILPPKNPSPRHLNPCRRLQRHDPQQLADEPDIHICDVYPGFVDSPGIGHGANLVGRKLSAPPPVLNPWRVAAAIVRLADKPRHTTLIGSTA